MGYEYVKGLYFWESFIELLSMRDTRRNCQILSMKSCEQREMNFVEILWKFKMLQLLCVSLNFVQLD